MLLLLGLKDRADDKDDANNWLKQAAGYDKDDDGGNDDRVAVVFAVAVVL